MNTNELYEKVGEAVHMSQVLELNLSFLMQIVNDHFAAGIDQDKLIIADDRRTLGQLIRELKKVVLMSDSSSDALGVALDARNILVHSFFNRNVYAFSDDATFQSACMALDKLGKDIVIASAITTGFIQGLCERLNIPMSEVLVKQHMP